MGAKISRHFPAAPVTNQDDLPEDYALLCDSIKHELPHITKMLLNQGCTLNIKQRMNSPLHLAALYESKEIVELLLKNNAEVHAVNETGKIPLHIACNQGNAEITRLLLTYDSDVNAKDDDDAAPIHAVLNQVIPEFVEYPDIEKLIEGVVKILVKHEADINIKEKHGFTPLHFSAKNGYVKVVEYLVTENAEINIVNEDNMTPLHLAIINGHKDVIKILLDAGASVDTKDIEGKTAFHYAVSAGNLDVVQLLMGHECNINAVDNNDERPIFSAIENNYLDILELLIKAGAGLRFVSKSLHTAVYKGFREVVRLVVDNGADVDERCPDGSTLLHHVIRNNWGYDFVNFLVENGANVNAVDKAGLNAATHAIINPQPEIVKYLIDNGVDPNKRDDCGYTLLHLAVVCRHTRFGCSKEQQELLKVLFENGANINAECKSGKTALHYVGDCVKRSLLSLIARKVAENNNISDTNMLLIRNNSDLSGVYAEFEVELDAMKQLKINNTISFFDILMKKNIHKLAATVFNEYIFKTLDSDDYKNKFPSYGEDVKKIILKKRKKSDMTMIAGQALAKYFLNLQGKALKRFKNLVDPLKIRKVQT